ncbi:glycosyltransferase family 2 protein [Pontibacter pudoricolor]|uniref:glycosyltransferase family 2 protein n=1 Tax=Pontibacter pudoricolor TaxID=2694930 RepID=UPI00139082FF|nr:glycosyltransferase family 2 protein [Pontibacter pudoricolor]
MQEHKWPKISIVTPSYNQGQFIEQTILSVINQSYPNLEFIIIDGGSTDNTIEVIKRYEKDITYWISEPDKGQSHAINKGLERCTGEIFNWLNSDDWYQPNALYEVALQFMNDPSVHVVSGYENHVYANGELHLCEGTSLMKTLEETIEWAQIAQPSTFFRTSIIKEVGPLPEDMHYIMDGELWVRYLLLHGQERFLKINKPLVNFRLHEGSKTVSNKVENNFLYERSSIIVDLQTFAGLPRQVTSFWIDEIYKTQKIYKLNRDWKINDNKASKRNLRLHFLKKYTNYHFHHKHLKEAKWGVKQLLLDHAYDFFLVKSIIKLGIRVVVR